MLYLLIFVNLSANYVRTRLGGHIVFSLFSAYASILNRSLQMKYMYKTISSLQPIISKTPRKWF